jgi:hypothetical protein
MRSLEAQTTTEIAVLIPLAGFARQLENSLLWLAPNSSPNPLLLGREGGGREILAFSGSPSLCKRGGGGVSLPLRRRFLNWRAKHR